MIENQDAGHDDEETKPSDKEKVNKTAGAKTDIIELSDIAIGITPEDDAIVELTEEVIGGALNGFKGAVREFMKDDEEDLDLSETEIEIDKFGQAVDAAETKSRDRNDQSDMDVDTLEEDISKELDGYFDAEMESKTTTEMNTPSPTAHSEKKDETADISAAGNIVVSESDVEAALERVIHKMYSEKINRLLDQIIETKVISEIDRFKKYMIGVLKK